MWYLIIKWKKKTKPGDLVVKDPYGKTPVILRINAVIIRKTWDKNLD